MGDGTKTYDLKSDLEQLRQNPLLAECWNTTVRNSDGTLKYEFAEFKGLKFMIKSEKVRLQGSLHKYRNKGLHNYDDFTSVELIEVLQGLHHDFKIDWTKTKLNNFEFGVNIVLPFNVSVILNNLITFKGEPFIVVVEENMSYSQCKKTHFIIKCYDKGKQYKLPSNLLRFEIKVIRMQYFESKKIPLRFFSDLLNIDVFRLLSNVLTEVFEGILFGDDTINEILLTEKEKEIFLRGNNPKTWIRQNGETERKRLHRLEDNYKAILERHRTGVDFKSVTTELIKIKGLELSRFYD
jgi:hypothetical protein